MRLFFAVLALLIVLLLVGPARAQCASCGTAAPARSYSMQSYSASYGYSAGYGRTYYGQRTFSPLRGRWMDRGPVRRGFARLFGR